jgi:hypothetical protein
VEAWENPTEGCKVSSVGANTNTTSLINYRSLCIPSKLPRACSICFFIFCRVLLVIRESDCTMGAVSCGEQFVHCYAMQDGNSVLWRTICALLDAMQGRECCVHGHHHGMTHSIDNPFCQAVTRIVCVVKFARDICYFRTVGWNLIFHWFLARMLFFIEH